MFGWLRTMRIQTIATCCTNVICRDYLARRFEFVYKPEHVEQRQCWACGQRLQVVLLNLSREKFTEMRLAAEDEE
jgi:hypothetical protein